MVTLTSPGCSMLTKITMESPMFLQPCVRFIVLDYNSPGPPGMMCTGKCTFSLHAKTPLRANVFSQIITTFFAVQRKKTGWGGGDGSQNAKNVRNTVEIKKTFKGKPKTHFDVFGTKCLKRSTSFIPLKTSERS